MIQFLANLKQQGLCSPQDETFGLHISSPGLDGSPESDARPNGHRGHTSDPETPTNHQKTRKAGSTFLTLSPWSRQSTTLKDLLSLLQSALLLSTWISPLHMTQSHLQSAMSLDGDFKPGVSIAPPLQKNVSNPRGCNTEHNFVLGEQVVAKGVVNIGLPSASWSMQEEDLASLQFLPSPTTQSWQT